MDYITSRRLESTIRALARRAGFSGDVLAPPPRQTTVARELQAECIVLDAGCYARDPAAKALARELARGAVYSSGAEAAQ